MEGKIVVSVIMPVRNEEDFIRRSLSAIVRQTYPPGRLEVIVADGRSTDLTREIVEEIMEECPPGLLRLIDNPGQLFSTGFNLGLQAARGEVIIMLSGHASAACDFVERCVEQLAAREEFDCVGGCITTVGLTSASQVIAAALGSWFGVGGVAFRTKPGISREVDTVAFGAYRRSAVTRCGPLDEELVHNQDDEYNYRLREGGGRILLCPDIHVRYSSRKSLGSLARQYFNYGYWKVRVMQMHPRQMRLRQFVPPAFTAALAAAVLLAPLPVPGVLPLALLGGMYLGAVAAASGLLMFRARLPHGLLLLAVFPVMHLSYGSGFLVGLARFADKWRSVRGGKPGRALNVVQRGSPYGHAAGGV